MTNSNTETVIRKTERPGIRAAAFIEAADALLAEMNEVLFNEGWLLGPDDPAIARLEKIKRRISVIRDLAGDVAEEIAEVTTAIHHTPGVDCGCDGEFGDEVVNVGRKVYGTCKTCRVYWCAGDNLFSGWRDELEELGEAAARELWAKREAELKASYRKHAPAECTF